MLSKYDNRLLRLSLSKLKTTEKSYLSANFFKQKKRKNVESMVVRTKNLIDEGIFRHNLNLNNTLVKERVINGLKKKP